MRAIYIDWADAPHNQQNNQRYLVEHVAHLQVLPPQKCQYEIAAWQNHFQQQPSTLEHFCASRKNRHEFEDGAPPLVRALQFWIE
jgi:hypothetical protein